MSPIYSWSVFLIISSIFQSSHQTKILDPRWINTGKWPSFPAYESFTVSNWKEYLVPFESCHLIHIINYENINLPQFPLPAISRYDVVHTGPKIYNGSRHNDHSTTYTLAPVGVKLPDGKISMDLFSVKARDLTWKIRSGWSCSVQLYLLPPQPSIYRRLVNGTHPAKDWNEIYAGVHPEYQPIHIPGLPTWFGSQIPLPYHSFQRPWNGWSDRSHGFTSFSHTWYHIALIPPGKEQRSSIMQREWNLMMNPILRWSHPSSHLIVWEVDEIIPDSKIIKISLGCKFCNKPYLRSYFEVKNTNYTPLTKKELDATLKGYDFMTTKTGWSSNWNSRTIRPFYKTPMSTLIHKNYLAFRNYGRIKNEWWGDGATGEDILIRILLENATWVTDSIIHDPICPNPLWWMDPDGREGHCDKWDPAHDIPYIEIDSDSSNMVKPTHVDEFKFISCGQKISSRVDFQGYVSQFDGWIWIWIMTFYVGLVTIFQFGIYVANKLWKCTFNLETNPYFTGIKILLEQGDDIAVNVKKLKWMYWICGAWILAAVVLTNSYRGDNVSKIHAPFEPQPIQHLSQLIDRGYELYTFIHTKMVPNFAFLLNPKVHTLFYLDTSNDITVMDVLEAELRAKESISDYSHSSHIKLLLKLQANKNSTTTSNKTRINLHKHAGYIYAWASLFGPSVLKSPYDYYDLIGECKNFAFFGWWKQNQLEQLFSWLELRNKRRESYKSLSFGIGKDVFGYKRRGWIIQRWGHVSVLKRLWGLVESGIFSKWKSHEKLVRTLEQRRLVGTSIQYKLQNGTYVPTKEKFEPLEKPVKLDSNILTVFCMFGIGIALGMLVFFWETFPKIVKELRKLLGHLKKKIGSCMKQLWVKKPFTKLMSRRRNKVHAKRENRLHRSDTQKIESTKDIQNGKRTNNKRTKDATKIEWTKDIQNGKRTDNKRTKDATKIERTKDIQNEKRTDNKRTKDATKIERTKDIQNEKNRQQKDKGRYKTL